MSIYTSRSILNNLYESLYLNNNGNTSITNFIETPNETNYNIMKLNIINWINSSNPQIAININNNIPIPGLRVLIVDADGSVIIDTIKTNTYQKYIEKSINENHNTRTYNIGAAISQDGIFYQEKYSTSAENNLVYLATRIGFNKYKPLGNIVISMINTPLTTYKTLKEMVEIYSLKYLKNLFSLSQLKDEYTITQLKEQYTLSELKDQFSVAQLKGKFTFDELKSVFSLAQLKDAYTLAELKDHFTFNELKSVFSLAQLKDEYTIAQLKDHFSLAELSDYFTPFYLVNYFTLQELKPYFTISDLFNYYSVSVMINNYTIPQLNIVYSLTILKDYFTFHPIGKRDLIFVSTIHLSGFKNLNL